MDKPIEEFTTEELHAIGFDAFQQREILMNQLRQLEQSINIIAAEIQSRTKSSEA